MSEQSEVIYSPPNSIEIKMLEGTITPEQLIEIEKIEKQKIEDEIAIYRKNYITQVKVIALDMCGKPLLYNPSLMSLEDKNKLILAMEEVMKLDQYEISNKFNILVSDKMFNSTANFEQLYNK